MDKPNSNPGRNVLSSDVEIKGEIKFSGELTFDGKIEGEIRGEGALNLGEGSVVNGNVDTQSAVIRGKVNGNVVAKDRLELKAKTELFGDIRASKLSIEEGVTFVGRAEINPNKIAASTGNGRINEPVKGPDVLKPAGAGR